MGIPTIEQYLVAITDFARNMQNEIKIVDG